MAQQFTKKLGAFAMAYPRPATDFGCPQRDSALALPQGILLQYGRLALGEETLRHATMTASLCILALVVGSCASVPMDAPAEDAAGKRFVPSSDGLAALYVYREAGFAGSALTINLTLGQRNIGSLGPGTWFRLEVEPGTYDLRCHSRENSDSIIVQLQSGQIQFIEASIQPGWAIARCGLSEAGQSDGRRGVLAGKRARDIRDNPNRTVTKAPAS